MGEKVGTRFGEFCSCFCLPPLLGLLAAFTQPGDHLLAEPCTERQILRYNANETDELLPSFAGDAFIIIFELHPRLKSTSP